MPVGIPQLTISADETLLREFDNRRLSKMLCFYENELRFLDKHCKFQREILDKYEINDEIGVGQYATVFLTRLLDTKYSMQYAVKSFRVDSIEDLRIFQRESFTLLEVFSKFPYQNIIKCYGSVCSTSSFEFGLVLEYVPCPSLDELLKRDSKQILQGNLLKQLTLRILDILDHLERAACRTHGDLKPSNILIDVANPQNLRLIDFGCSEDIGQKSINNPGTIYYMAPEKQQSFHTADIRSDIWSLGVLLLDILTQSNEQRHTAFEHTEAIGRRLSECDCAPIWKEIVLKCLVVNVEMRPRPQQLIAMLTDAT